MFNIQFDTEQLREIISEEVKKAVSEAVSRKELPPLLTRKELMELLHISQTKTSELLGRADFPVFREAGVLIPTKSLFEWIDRHTDWVEENTRYFKSVI
ncbi:helix-turn-helix domain-containing protein [Rummeliibacillus stabekisii]|uniref:helix-turn-helix domain-containing protein n=1 Tax=Rummeliibacillus stabekisii TaxID=241244 RepID=UPI0020403D2A|nr:helix-turn-helix domain-containing protein [Rummeliibacillus stabekisii]MCM3316150.1 helix-turn-helix domain-containing protein [Rummeliibacillus stabekisii]